MKISDDVIYVGVNDTAIDLFEGQFTVPDGMSYNSYVILDEKIAVMDSVDQNFGDEWLKKIETVLGGKKPDYLVVHHIEPDHSANILKFAEKYPEAKLVASVMAFNGLKNYFGTDFSDRRVVVKEGDALSLGKHNLKFVAAPNVHWPEVMLSYDETDKILFSADAFGKFGAIDEANPLDDWACEARRYYFGIVGKFGSFVQPVLKKAGGLDIKIICPLHGPVLSGDLSEYLKLYDTWSSYGVETEGVTVAYTSVYGHTKRAVETFVKKLEDAGCPKMEVIDLARGDVHEAIEAAFRYGKIVLASTTYCGEVFPAMREFIEALTERNYQNRKVAIIENGSWVPAAAKKMKELFANSKNITYCENNITIKGEATDANFAQMDALVKELI